MAPSVVISRPSPSCLPFFHLGIHDLKTSAWKRACTFGKWIRNERHPKCIKLSKAQLCLRLSLIFCTSGQRKCRISVDLKGRQKSQRICFMLNSKYRMVSHKKAAKTEVKWVKSSHNSGQILGSPNNSMLKLATIWGAVRLGQHAATMPVIWVSKSVVWSSEEDLCKIGLKPM